MSVLSPESQTRQNTTHECPDAYALDLFKHQIAYENTGQLHPFRDPPSIHVDEWTRGSVTVFYIRDYVKGAVPPNQRLLYMFDSKGRNEPGVCLPDEAEDVCVDEVINLGNADKAPTCTVTIDLRSIPPWKPSANDAAKRQIARELRAEIETLYPISKEILIRDFNVKDPQITFLIRAESDYFQGCSFQAKVKPHCDGWHLFGQVSRSSLRKWVLERPYRLK